METTRKTEEFTEMLRYMYICILRAVHRSKLNDILLTDREQDLQGRVGLLEIHHPLVQTDLAVLRLVVRLEAGQLVLLQPAEGKDNVGAEIGLNVLR